jgi:quinoprotein glucose dehydrogenase
MINFFILFFLSLLPNYSLFANDIYSSWFRSGGNDKSMKYSSLTQINKNNFSKLERAWIYHSGNQGNVETNPIFTLNMVFTTNRDGFVIAIDASNGLEVWRTKLPGEVGKRGLTYSNNLIYVPTSEGVFVLNVLDGSINLKYGSKGKFGNSGSALPPVVTNESIITANITSIESFNINTGKLNWATSMEKEGFKPRIWSGFSYDESNKIIYVVTANGAWFLDENFKAGGNACSLLAIDASTGNVLWGIQEKHNMIYGILIWLARQ